MRDATFAERTATIQQHSSSLRKAVIVIASNLIDNSMVLKSIQASSTQRGIPGKLFVLLFVGLLAVLCVLMISVAVRFQSIMARLEASRSLWPQASQELLPRYDQIDLATMSATDKASWDKSKDEFHSSTLFDRQSQAAMELELQLKHAVQAGSETALVPFQANSPGIAKLIESEQNRRDVQAGFIGWLTVSALRLRLPAIYDPLSVKR